MTWQTSPLSRLLAVIEARLLHEYWSWFLQSSFTLLCERQCLPVKVKMTLSRFQNLNRTLAVFMSIGKRIKSLVKMVFYTAIRWTTNGTGRMNQRTAALFGNKYLLVLEGWILDISFDSYDCALKKSDHKCRAKAIVQVTYHEPEEGGPVPPPTLTLVSIHSPEWHSHNPDSSKYLADHIMQIMKDNITRNPCDRIGNIIFFSLGSVAIFTFLLGPMVERVFLQESQKWEHNKPLKAKILNSFPQSKLSTLYAHRKAITGNIPGWLWIFSFYIFSLVSFKLQEMILILFLSSTILSLVPQSLSSTPILCLRSGGRFP